MISENIVFNSVICKALEVLEHLKKNRCIPQKVCSNLAVFNSYYCIHCENKIVKRDSMKAENLRQNLNAIHKAQMFKNE